jgi:hypothetical protein
VLPVPVKLRHPKGRRPVFSAEAIALFRRLDRASPRQRTTDDFKAEDRELALLLGLEIEWFCSAASVTDKRRPPSSPERPAERDQVRVYDVRLQLLAALESGTQAKAAPMGSDAAVWG